MDEIILASASPRRTELLERMGIPFLQLPQDADESFTGLSAQEEAVEIASRKVRACTRNPVSEGRWILGADTFVTIDGLFLGKPANRADAASMLAKLSGRTHRVVSGLALRTPDGRLVTASAVTDVTFISMSCNEIEWYLDQHEWQGAAAAYRIQEKGGMFISSINGSYSNVMGLPISLFYGMLTQNNYIFRAPVA